MKTYFILNLQLGDKEHIAPDIPNCSSLRHLALHLHIIHVYLSSYSQKSMKKICMNVKGYC